MNILTKNRILQKGDEVLSSSGEWRPVPDSEFGLQIEFSKYGNMQIRRPSETISPVSERPQTTDSETETPVTVTDKAEAEQVPASGISPAGRESPPKPLSETYEAAKPKKPKALPTVVSPKAHGKKPKSDKGNITLVPVVHGVSSKDAIKERNRKVVEEAKAHAANEISIPYPATATNTIWIGRNGTFNATGMNLHKLHDDRIRIVPQGKRGEAKNALIEFPTEIIPQVIDFLLRHQPAAPPTSA